MPRTDSAAKQASPTPCKAMRAARAWSGMTAEEWASRLGYSRAQINNYETNTIPDDETLQRAADAIGAPIEWMRHGFNPRDGVAPLGVLRRASEILRATDPTPQASSPEAE